MTIEQGGSLETYWSKDRTVTAKFLKEHTPRRYYNLEDLACSCGWYDQSEPPDPNAWTVHLTDALNATNPNVQAWLEVTTATTETAPTVRLTTTETAPTVRLTTTNPDLVAFPMSGNCGKCGHLMHFMGCFASVPTSDGAPFGECPCRTDVAEFERVAE